LPITYNLLFKQKMSFKIILFIAVLATPALGSTYNYANPDADWPAVNAACTNTGTAKQSPINIARWSASINTSELTLSADYTSRSGLSILNADGHTQKVKALKGAEFGKITYAGKKYKF